jgi:hypothetical protein
MGERRGHPVWAVVIVLLAGALATALMAVYGYNQNFHCHGTNDPYCDRAGWCRMPGGPGRRRLGVRVERGSA